MSILKSFLKNKSKETIYIQNDNTHIIDTYSNNLLEQVVDNHIQNYDMNVIVKKYRNKVVPSKRGLYPHEIALLTEITRCKTQTNTLSKFFLYQCQIDEPQLVLSSLYKRQFIDVEDVHVAIKKETVDTLKSILRIHDLKVSGNKNELLDRLESGVTDDELRKCIPDRSYYLTEIGKCEIDENSYIPYVLSHNDMSIWEMNLLLDSRKGLSYRDIIWGYMNELSGKLFIQQELGAYRNVRHRMFRFLLEEDKPKTAFHFLCEVALYDLGITDNMKNFQKYKQKKDSLYYHMIKNFENQFLPYENSKFKLSPGIKNEFVQMKNHFFSSEKEFVKTLKENIKDIHIPYSIFNHSECVNIIMYEINDEKKKLNTLYDRINLKERLHKL